MIPKSGNWFSDEITRKNNKKLMWHIRAAQLIRRPSINATDIDHGKIREQEQKDREKSQRRA
jgi:hypothetical protein